MNWMDMTLREFQAALASSSPTPGGGTAAAVALGQAAALSVMVCDLTLGNEKWKEGWKIAEEVQFKAIPMLHQSGTLAKDDSDAFDGVMAGFGMPKSTEDEMHVRRQAIRNATLEAARVPFETARLAMELLVLLPELADKGNANAASDVGVAGLLASAAAKGAVFNVEINLESLPQDMGQEIRRELPDIKERVKQASRQAMEAVRSRMNS
ncbi:MAG: cyclodeaminase/cyclohydrolase family protein [Candidatus Poseidonia sp.]|nr:cyclodeaminase/cyclohydrolase family protein [Poseidonia sp.]